MELVQPDLSVLVVILLVLSLFFILKRSFFDPINKILEDRETAIHGAQRTANKKLGEFEEKSRIYQDQLNAARLEIYRQQETLRSEALNRRADILAKGRQEAEGLVQSSRDELQKQVVSAKSDLESNLTQFADGIVKAILR
jgi:F0F1-type ATP synthase membrane subunit b/b'